MASTPIHLTILGRQSEPNGEPQEIKMMTEGRLYQQSKAQVIAYRENDHSGLGRTLTTLKVMEDGHIELLRSGETQSKMTFRAGERHLTQLQTPVGLMTIGLLTHEAYASMNPDEGLLRIRYALDYSNQNPVDMTLELKYRKVEAPHES